MRSSTFAYERRRLQNALLLATGDAIAITLAVGLAGLVRMHVMGLSLIPMWSWYLLPAWALGAALIGLLPSWGLGPVEELRRSTILLTVIFGVAAIFLFLSKQSADVSRMTLTLTFVFSVVLIPLIRLRTKRLLIGRELWGLPTAIYGSGEAGRSIARLLLEERGLGYNPVCIYDGSPSQWGTAIESLDLPGTVTRLRPDASVAMIAISDVGLERTLQLLEGPLSNYRSVLMITTLVGAPSLWIRPRDLNGTIGLEIRCNLQSPVAQAAKRSVDLAITLLLAPLWVPLCLALALAIWLSDRGSPLFLQERLGADGSIFQTWKFRTMVPDAEEVLQRALRDDPALREEWERCYKLKVDPRVTLVGRVMRRYSLDELPQLVNVLRGEMSLVGPRPLPAYHHTMLPARVRMLRERVRPGITGLWQVSGRSDIGTEGMEQLDPYYVRNWSLWLDIVVLVRTLRTVINKTGAY